MLADIRPWGASLALCLSWGCSGPKAPSSEGARSPSKSAPERAELEATKVSYSMRGNEEDYRKCFMRAISQRGAVSLAFAVDAEGAVEQTEVLWSSIGNEIVEQCLMERMKQQRFGSRQEPARGKWTFVFRLSDPITDEEREELLEKAEDGNENSFELLSESSGTIDARHLDEMVQLRYPLYAHCYRDSIRRRGESRGLLRLRLQIDESGRLTSVQDAGSVLPDPFAVDCMAEAFYAIDFPKPKGGPVIIRYGLDFD
jgi:hypothetical protein